MNPTLYDILGVSHDASREEIRNAWRDAADRFEPGEGGSPKQFRLFNEAAEVLLDPERRKAYDARLDEAGPASADETGSPDATPAASAAVPASSVPGSTRAVTAATPGAGGDLGSAKTAEAPGGEDTEGHGYPTAGEARDRRTVPWQMLVALGVLAAVAVGLATYAVTAAQRADSYQEALDRAPAAAESAAAAVLSYDYTSLEADRDAAAKFLSDGYRSDYVDTFDKLVSDSATETKAKVEAQVLASSAMTSGEERNPDRVPVLLFVNQTTTSATSSGQPSVALNRVRFDMVEVDGTWLVDGITSY